MTKPKRRIVVTGMGICSSIGNTLIDVTENLRTCVSGIAFDQEFADHGFKSQVSGRVKNLTMPPIERDIERALGDGNLLRFAYHAMYHAVQDSGLTPEEVSAAGLIMGNGGPSTRDQTNATDKTRAKGKPRLSPLIVFPVMTSGPAALLATAFKIKGFNYMVGAACASSTLAIGEAYKELLFDEDLNVVFAGGAESADWELAQGFDMMAMCGDRNHDPTRASRPFDATRSGFVLAEGAGVVVLEVLEHALARGAQIYAEIVGYGKSSDGDHLTEPNQDGVERAIRKALAGVGIGTVHYINAHGTSTALNDANELEAFAAVFGEDLPPFSSTKSATGHSLGAAGAQELIYSILGMVNDFMPASLNVTQPDPILTKLGMLDYLVQPDDGGAQVLTAYYTRFLTTNYGFGGVNVALAVDRY